MKESLQKRCEMFIRNRLAVKKQFRWESAYMYPLSAIIFTEKGQEADLDKMLRCREMLRDKASAFSNFRGTVRLAVISLLAACESPQQKLENGLKIYELLRREFFSSEYLAVTALLIAEHSEPESFEAAVKKTRRAYELMKEDHRFLTSREDCAFAALLAMSEKGAERGVKEAEKCFEILKPSFFSGNAVQSLSHVLALGEELPESKCRRTVELFEALKERGLRYGTSYELPALGALGLLETDQRALVSEIEEADLYLQDQKGFGAFGVGSKQRLMYAGMLVSGEYAEEGGASLRTAAINSALSLIAAQQAAVCAATASACAAAAASSNSSS
ncbi:DUF4003 family protein [Cuneatibacter caecimuris]|uniref:Uncharacterized protein DUF4003 n=1 Tax=Cuneatibacter caecimuris TaxID=1796618 RepID=A0A4Q7PQC3_9FIRM|nr:DUF4003 family protein [Cuneatibacter caecimuris]RZT02208.1 uncharacterized protein DUF4003 [Cuneatibacter caecimuris]